MKISLMLAGIFLLSACTVHSNLPNRMIIDSDGIIIDSSKNYHKNSHKNSHKKQNRYFCPPGQAKKRNC